MTAGRDRDACPSTATPAVSVTSPWRPTNSPRGGPSAIFRLFVMMAMYQARRDVVIMAQQRSMSREAAALLFSADRIRRAVAASPCVLVEEARDFDGLCQVAKLGTLVDCPHLPGTPCHVKAATVRLNRMGDLGKMPTSAWRLFGKRGHLARTLAGVPRVCPFGSGQRTRRPTVRPRTRAS